MSEERLHRKRAYSQMVIRKAFLELLETTPVNKITVRDVCERADVNRTTFYANFTDIYALLQSIKDDLLREIRESVEAASGMRSSDVILREVFRAINDNIDICRVVLMLPDDEFVRSVIDLAYERMLCEWEKRASKGERAWFDYLFEFQAMGCIGIIRKWISDGPALPYAAVADYTIQFAAKTLELF